MFRVAGVLSLCLALSGAAAEAATITYEFEGSSSGSLGGAAYVDAHFLVTILADSSDPTVALSTAFDISGVGAGTINNVTVFVNNGSCDANQEYPAVDSCVGFSNALYGDFVDVGSNDFDAYVLGNPIGPVVDDTAFGNLGALIPTSEGDWIIFQHGRGSFTATVDDVPVPEPAAFGLMAAGLAGYLARRREAGRRAA